MPLTLESAQLLFGKAYNYFPDIEVVLGPKWVLEFLRLFEWVLGGQLLHFRIRRP